MGMALQPDSPLYQRLGGYLLERFPPVAYTLLTVLFFGSSVWVAIALGGGELRPNGWLGAVVVWLVFLHLRIFDEHKDAEVDRAAHPERAGAWSTPAGPNARPGHGCDGGAASGTARAAAARPRSC